MYVIKPTAVKHGVTLVIRSSRSDLAEKFGEEAIYHPAGWLSIGRSLVIWA